MTMTPRSGGDRAVLTCGQSCLQDERCQKVTAQHLDVTSPPGMMGLLFSSGLRGGIYGALWAGLRERGFQFNQGSGGKVQSGERRESPHPTLHVGLRANDHALT